MLEIGRTGLQNTNTPLFLFLTVRTADSLSFLVFLSSLPLLVLRTRQTISTAFERFLKSPLGIYKQTLATYSLGITGRYMERHDVTDEEAMETRAALYRNEVKKYCTLSK